MASDKEAKEFISDINEILPELAVINIGDIECKVDRLKFKHTIVISRMMFRSFGIVDWKKLQSSNMQDQIMTLFMAITNSPTDFYIFLDSLLICNKDNQDKLKIYIRDKMSNDEAFSIAEAIIKQDSKEIDGWLKKVLELSQIMEKKTQKIHPKKQKE